MGGHRYCCGKVVDRDAVDLQLRVIVVTTRAALRHVDGDPRRRALIIERGRALVEGVAQSVDDGSVDAIDRALAELASLADG
jgi:hypothetical protein